MPEPAALHGRPESTLLPEQRVDCGPAEFPGAQSLRFPHDIHHGIDGADFMESHVLWGHTVDAALLFRQQPESTDGALAYPVGERCVLQRRDEIPHVVMRSVGLARIVGVVRAGSVRVRFGPRRVRRFHLTVRGVDRDLGG